MPNKGFNYDFRLFLEGIQTPFKSIQILCTPNGVEANVNLLSNQKIFSLKPKTAVQVFYRDWVPVDKKYGWRLMFDGFLSSYFKTDEATEGRGLGIVCRDFRMDIRKAPAALAWQGKNELTNMQYYHTAGLFHNWVVRGLTPPAKKVKSFTDAEKESISKLEREANLLKFKIKDKDISPSDRFIAESRLQVTLSNLAKKKQTKTGSKTVGGKGHIIRTWGNSGLDDLPSAIAMIAGTAYGRGLTKDEKTGDFNYSREFGRALRPDNKGGAQGGMFLDAVIRGMWTEAVGGTSIGAFQNKRTRVDKRFMIPKNDTGYNFWRRSTGGLQIGSVIMGNSRFSSLEAAIMRLAGLFSVRVYSCNTPSLVDLDGPALKWVMDPQVKAFLVDKNSLEFGPKYILNETMLLPPLEFTAPPNCNLIFPPMCNKITWQYDIDADVTRGYFRTIDSISARGAGASLNSKGVQVPTALFDLYKEAEEGEGASKDEYGRKKPTLTLEERYKGVSVVHGSVEMLLAQNDAAKSWPKTTLSPKKAADVEKQIKKIEQEAEEVKPTTSGGATFTFGLVEDFPTTIPAPKESYGPELVKASEKKAEKTAARHKKSFTARTQEALNRHAILKFLNRKYAGRVAVVDMPFNPYIMSGFPGAIIVDDEAYGGESSKTVLGMVQQVKHLIVITPNGGDATTSVVLNNARFEDEATDVDEFGNPLYMKPTISENAEIDTKTNEYSNSDYSIPEPKPQLKRDKNNTAYDLNESIEGTDYIYAKDLLTLTAKDLGSGKSNNIYLDDEYMPNRIHKFYKEVFSHKSDHFMIGDGTDPDGNKFKFAYDSMHEAFKELRSNHKVLLTNYEECLKFVSRDVCSADAFFQGVLGLSRFRKMVDKDGNPILDKNGVQKTEYSVWWGDYNPEELDNEYFGIATSVWDEAVAEKEANPNPTDGKPYKNKVAYLVSDGSKKSASKMTGAGQFSSILEHMPITAFIQERKKAVKEYVKEVKERAQGAQFANIQRNRPSQ